MAQGDGATCDASRRMEFLIELIVEFFVQILLELVFESGFRAIASVLAQRIARIALGIIISVGLGFGGGFWWGSRLSELGRTDPPKSLWVSIGLLVAFAVLALVQTVRRSRFDITAETITQPLQDKLLPWRWSPLRLFGFAAVNGAVALGIAIGFSPKPLR
jgi:hypothetical protein